MDSTKELDTLFGNSNKQQAMQLLGKGYKKSLVASVLNVSPSLISSYLEDDKFVEGVRDIAVERQLAVSLRDETIDEIEDAALEQLKTYMPLVTKPMEALKIAQAMNGMTRRSAGGQEDSGSEAKVQELQLPQYLIQVEGDINIQVNTNNEVVEVNGRHMTTMPSLTVAEKLKERILARENKQEVLPHE